MTSQPHFYSGINLTSEYVCIAQYSPETNSIVNVVIKFFESLGTSRVAGLKEEFKKLAREVKLANQDVCCGIPSDCAIIKRIFIDADEEHVDEALAWELGQQVVGVIEEYVFDYERCAGIGDAAVSGYLVIAYRADAVADVTDVLKSVKMNPQVIEPDIISLVNLFELNYSRDVSGPAMVTLVEDGTIKAAVVSDGALIDFNSVAYTPESITPSDLASSIRGLVQGFKDAHSSIQTLSVYAAGSIFTRSEFVEQTIDTLENAQLLNPFTTVSFDAQMAAEDLKKYAPQMAVAVGLALRLKDEQ